MLTRLKVNGFKNLVDVDVRFGPFTCIAGANGVGKSNLFDAIAFLSALAEFYACDVLFVHRDAERQPWEDRVAEIAAALDASDISIRSVPVVPVRMQEAWLLTDEAAIREAAGNPVGRIPLQLPRSRDLARVPDPKRVLHEALCAASALSGRRLERFKRSRLAASVTRVAELTSDFSPLRDLSAFAALERDVVAVLGGVGVGPGKVGDPADEQPAR